MRRGVRGGSSRVDPNVQLAAYLASLGSGVKAWFDSSSDAYFTFSTGAQISAWVSRIGAQTLSQATSANQPLRNLATSFFGGVNTVRFDGSNDSLAAVTNPNYWKFWHDGTGASVYIGYRCDSTGGANQSLFYSAGTTAQHGVHVQLQTTRIAPSVFNGSGTVLNGWLNSTSAHFVRDVARVQMFGYVDGTQHSRVSGSSLTNADTVGQDPSASNPSFNLFVGNGDAAFKGDIADIIALNSIASADVHANITGLLARKLRVAA